MTDDTSDRLESWKEIAAYLRRDVTTVQRWEKKEALPVHRHLHDRLGSVYAFKSELDVWRARHSAQPALVESEGGKKPQRRIAPHVVALIAAAAAIAGVVIWLRAPAHDSPGTYDVDVSLHRVESQELPLTPGARIAPGDRLYLVLEASRSVYVYVVNEDDRGDAHLLFPVPATELTNPVAANRRYRLPGTRDGRSLFWQVTSAGGREHFYVLVSPERLASFERVVESLPEAEAGRAVLAVPLKADSIGTLRGIGGITEQAPQKRTSWLADALPPAPPLEQGRHRAQGLWVRHLTLDNPVK